MTVIIGLFKGFNLDHGPVVREGLELEQDATNNVYKNVATVL